MVVAQNRHEPKSITQSQSSIKDLGHFSQAGSGRSNQKGRKARPHGNCTMVNTSGTEPVYRIYCWII